MLSQDIESCAASIDVLAGQVSEEQQAFLRMLQENLRAHAAQARHLEQELLPPAGAGTLRFIPMLISFFTSAARRGRDIAALPCA